MVVVVQLSFDVGPLVVVQVFVVGPLVVVQVLFDVALLTRSLSGLHRSGVKFVSVLFIVINIFIISFIIFMIIT